MSNFELMQEQSTIFFKRFPLSSLGLLHLWVFICEGNPGWVTATCAAYAACTNRPVPNRKFFLWCSFCCGPAWSYPQSRWAAEISDVSFDLPIWLLLDDIHCSVKRWENLTQRALFSESHLSFCNHLDTGICSNKIQFSSAWQKKCFRDLQLSFLKVCFVFFFKQHIECSSLPGKMIHIDGC